MILSFSNILKKITKKYKINISVSYIFYIIKYKLNLTNKQLRRKYYPEKKLSTLKRIKLIFINTLLIKENEI